MIFATAENIVAALNAESFDEAFTATMDVLPRFDKSDFEHLLVTVLPVGEEYANETRGTYSVDVTIDIGVQIRVGKDKNVDVVRYSTFTKAILDFLFNQSFEGARFVSIERNPVYDVDALTDNVFTSIITATYRGWSEQVTLQTYSLDFSEAKNSFYLGAI